MGRFVRESFSGLFPEGQPSEHTEVFFLIIYLFIYLFIYGCTGSSLLRTDFL